MSPPNLCSVHLNSAVWQCNPNTSRAQKGVLSLFQLQKEAPQVISYGRSSHPGPLPVSTPTVEHTHLHLFGRAGRLLGADRDEVAHLVSGCPTHHGRLIGTEHGEGLKVEVHGSWRREKRG